jgi:hypothetical protein
MFALRAHQEIPGAAFIAMIGWTAIVGVMAVVWLASLALTGHASFAAGPAEIPPLELPRLAGLDLPAVGEPLAQPQIPTGFFGCWSGRPRKFESVVPATNTDSLYRLDRVTKCYAPNAIETRQFLLALTPRNPTLTAILEFLNLGHHEAEVEREETRIYALAPNQIYSRGTLKLELSTASLFKFPKSKRYILVDEEIATLVDPDNLTVVGRAFLTGTESRSVGTWHADFHH